MSEVVVNTNSHVESFENQSDLLLKRAQAITDSLSPIVARSPIVSVVTDIQELLRRNEQIVQGIIVCGDE